MNREIAKDRRLEKMREKKKGGEWERKRKEEEREGKEAGRERRKERENGKKNSSFCV